MDAFDLLEQMDRPPNDGDVECLHEKRKLDRGVSICLTCGLSERINEGQTYTSHKMYKRAFKDTNIVASLEQKGFDRRIIITANKIYNLVVNEHSKRTGNRSSIICACIFQAFKILGQPVDYAHIYSKYDIKKRSALKGLKIVNTEIAKHKMSEFHDIISTPVVPENFILSYMEELKAPSEAIREVLNIYQSIQHSRELNMSRPQSIAAGVIFYWLKQKGRFDAMKIIEEKANLSQLTISKKAKIVASKIEELQKGISLKSNEETKDNSCDAYG